MSKEHKQPRFIVGEVSKSWQLLEVTNGEVISRQFEKMIAYNLKRGYMLHSFQLNRIMESETKMNETLVAVFERLESLRLADALLVKVQPPKT